MRYAGSNMSHDSVEPTASPVVIVDPFGRATKSLRLSVTQMCNLSCPHCHREGQAPSLREMSPEEIERLVKVGASLGISKVKVTGGEPLVRDDIVEIISKISPLVREVSLTTNGSRLSELAVGLKRAGLARVNVSLPTLDPRLYTRLCGGDDSKGVIRGIKASIDVGLNPVKVNMVVFKDENASEIPSMIDFCGRIGAVLQLIELEADKEGSDSDQFTKRHYSLGPVEAKLAGQASSVSENELHRRRRYQIGNNGTAVTVEVVRPMHNTKFCANCTRIRMSSDGLLKPCLFDRAGQVDVLTSLRNGASDGELRELFLRAIASRRPYWS